jgi:hypothetical protein
MVNPTELSATQGKPGSTGSLRYNPGMPNIYDPDFDQPRKAPGFDVRRAGLGGSA